MANTFFDFDTTINKDENLLPDDDDCIENEEEYDALNDETFGAVDITNLDDWEQQHEQFAEIAENSKHSEQIENSISQLVLSGSDSDSDSHETSLSLTKNSVWAYIPTTNGPILDSAILSTLQKASKSFIKSHISDTQIFNTTINNDLNNTLLQKSLPTKICTVEELEKNLLKSSTKTVINQAHQIPQQQIHGQQRPMPTGLQGLPQRPPMPQQVHPRHPFHPMMQHPNSRLPPPGMHPMGIPPPGMRHLPPQMGPHHPHPPPHVLPPGMMRMVPPHHPQFMPPNGPPRPPGFMFPHGSNQLPMNHPYNFLPPPPHNMQSPNHHQQLRPGMHNMPPHQQQMGQSGNPHYQQQGQQNHRVRHDSGGHNYRENHHRERQDSFSCKDEYADLMTARDKQWLLNIQLLQLNTGTPYFDDYYYTIFKEKKLKNNKENIVNNDRNGRHPNHRQRRNSERQDNNVLTPKVYTPLQFENSLGKLQCGSVTAPRKIIDMDVVTLEKDGDSPAVSRDTRKTKQLLLELEILYSYLLKAEDINNPMFISNMEKLRELKQKQRFRELEQATTSEQKQEVLRLFKQESEPVVENQLEYIVKVVNGLLQEDKFCSFLNIRKGKMLVLRILPHLTLDQFSTQLLEIWSKVLLSLPIVGRRDTAGDNILPKLHPFFKRYIQTCTMSDILHISSGLIEVVKQENGNRSTPLSHVGKAPLYFVLLNKFGVSALVILLIKAEYLISTDKSTEKQNNCWSNFLLSWSQHSELVSKIATPLELIPSQIFNKHCNRFPNLKSDKKSILEKYFVEV